MFDDAFDFSALSAGRLVSAGAAVLGLLAGAFACDAETGPTRTLSDTGWRIDAAEAGTDPDGGGPGEPQPVSFGIENQTDSPIHIGRLGRTEERDDWVQLYGGDGSDAQTRLKVQRACSECLCEELGTDECGPCGRPVPPRETRTIEPEGSHSWTWSGYVYRRSSVGDRTCVERDVPRQSRRLDVLVCWSAETDGGGLGDRTCERMGLNYGETSSLTHVVRDDDAEPEPRTLRLRNGTDDSLAVWRPSPCSQQPKDWAQIHRYQFEGRDRVKARTHCAECTCQGDDPSTCLVCDAPCPPGSWVGLSAGETREWKWDGNLYTRMDADQMTCWAPSAAEGRFAATFCWSDAPPESSGESPPPEIECESVDFRTDGDGPIEHEVTREDDEPDGVEFRLENDSEESVRVQRLSSCRQSDADWLKVRETPQGTADIDEPTRVALQDDCLRCECRQIRGPDRGCAVCAKACAAPQTTRLGPGESQTFDWDGTLFRRRETHGRSCFQRRGPDTGEAFEAAFCWGDSNSTPPGSGNGRTCRTVRFRYGKTGAVEHTID